MSKLILIDDDPMYHKISQLMLREYSVVKDVVSSTDAKATIDFLEENKENPEQLPDYIFVDLNMPGYNGWDFLNDYRKIYDSLKKAIRVYIVSSSIAPHDIKKSKTYSFVNSFIIKPLTREFLHELMA
ncbi:response regulator [Mucilaginibacter ginsenosidivorans]|uniref:Response regulator n=1 Tax=Mucilaginibacter ginsenosidivorans TaxID=398053 RepID=A0A5B8V0D8_9SPHI|nr:response regulator [Mucilaginibacter ginsenosidivorans]QEC64900.1 response regulator [Mucilaginibacter ginsenosidivorans]